MGETRAVVSEIGRTEGWRRVIYGEMGLQKLERSQWTGRKKKGLFSSAEHLWLLCAYHVAKLCQSMN